MMPSKTIDGVRQAGIPITFLIVGGGVAGLSCAIALRRVGHHAIVLEQDQDMGGTAGGCRMPPNLSKILFHWGLGDKLRSISVKSEAVNLRTYETGEFLGKHIWSEEVLRETRGEFSFAHLVDFRHLLYDAALSSGAEVRFNASVTSIDTIGGTVTLASGNTLTADVIVGADGQFGLTRSIMLAKTGHVEKPDKTFNMYSTIVSRDAMLQDAQLNTLLAGEPASLHCWFGNRRSVLAFPIGGAPDFAVYIYGPNDGQDKTWNDAVAIEGLRTMLGPCEERLQKLGELVSTSVCVAVNQRQPLEEWVTGRLVLIGQAAHPIAPGAIQDLAMSVESSAVLAKLFSHLQDKEQIGSLLEAFEDLRRPRCLAVHAKEFGTVHYMTMEPSEAQELRDSTYRAKRDAGLNVLESADGVEETLEWTEIKEIFGYEAEDEADNWWVQWGLLRERAKGVDLKNDRLYDNVHVTQVVEE